MSMLKWYRDMLKLNSGYRYIEDMYAYMKWIELINFSGVFPSPFKLYDQI